jgi:tyrosine-specific transport protein
MNSHTQQQGSVFGAIMLVAGCCVGAGMLGLPVLSSAAGFIPSAICYILAWLFMTCTGLLLLEVNLWFKDNVSIISMVDRTLGPLGRSLSWFLYLFLFYSVMVAYIAGSGGLFSDLYARYTGNTIALWTASLIFVTIFGIIIYRGTLNVDWVNRLLMFGLIITYVALIGLGLPSVDVQLLKRQDWKSIVLVIPAMIISFGFHNLVPSLTTYLNHDAKKLRLTLIIGSSIPLFIYLVWQFVILGIVPSGGFQESLDEGAMVTHALKNAAGSPWVILFAEYFALFAIVTSFLAVAFSFVDFLSDGLKIEKTNKGKIILCLLTLVPPFAFAVTYPYVFLNALNYAGAFGAVVLFGIFPAIMVWKGRYRQHIQGIRLLGGGRITLILIIIVALGVFLMQLFRELNVI